MFSLFASRRWREIWEAMDRESQRRAYVDRVYSTDNIEEFIHKYNNLEYVERDIHRASSLFPCYAFYFDGDSNMIKTVIDMTEEIKKGVKENECI